MAKETELWATLKRLLPTEGVYKRIENIVEAGTPDSFLMLHGTCCWAELKIIKGVRKPHFASEFTGLQAAWLYDYYTSGGTAFLIGGRSKRKGDPIEEIWVWKGSQILELHTWGLTAGPSEVTPWKIFPRPWDKDTLNQALFPSYRNALDP